MTKLKFGRKRDVGRSRGKISVRHKGGGEKRLYRVVDFKRDKRDIPAKVEAIEYDPNRSAKIALLLFPDGERHYILAPEEIKVGSAVLASEKASAKVGNALPLGKIPVGTEVHNVELIPGQGGKMIRAAGTAAVVLAKEKEFAHLKMPSGEIRKIRLNCWATVGRLTGVERKMRRLGKAGIKRHLGIRPTVRGVAQHPRAHPHGGGEGKSGIGMPSPKTPWGKPTLGKKTRKRFHTDKYIVARRKK
ncbi:50S ribosomal protein L2 [candidate division WWE3 bacterium CG09_land_8_20_14_0_10_47_33]|uniref:Large ribosomal subunit protein uL2 n=1 Tax=candidate division WWE3 bacterium CG_4_9_14_0_2_um_filter_48_10 TaxID=1975078 RepID=A0A2M8EJU3_UNCKA|nr:MAG: 50S ribosomal protein L2 [candidate division WWE3 bacterium CG09_land_8_20_14_0_10_47_33]PIZ40704.1 MAG: 50S ribosomal protein L2 [candidate division WWE3 bacterium CG_4_10_14_0_2_um_filter_47_8]PJC22999.1 MAG: 50S ribosomal protein L2 [candidate division WWE3 bacterium CG_4_9_14_0_2_um_filter_48_10]PJE51241.1 MAG: 50S ribosomal protein L2 [candidate division WWE3 bacterium CG10_big_fil_rev_8_21_14_0_10_48_23]